MTITIDCRHIESSGMGVFTRECLPIFLNSAHSFILLGNREKLTNYTSNHSNAEILDCRIKPFSLRELFFFPSHCLSKINSADCYFSPYFNIPCGIKIPIYTIIHDIMFPDFPELCSKIGLAARMWFYRRAFKRSKKVFTVSRYSKSRIEYYLGNKVPLVVICNGIQSWMLQIKKKEKKNNTIVFIGNIKKHKGLELLLDAFLLAKAEGLSHQLIIIGKKDNFRTRDNSFLKKIDSFEGEFVNFTGHISDEKLAEYLSAAALLVQPSLFEGFGIPPLEAMTLGTQALISDIPVLREVYEGFPVVFFRSGDKLDLKNKMMDILFNKEPSSVHLSDELLSKYTFQKATEAILGVLQ